MNQGALSKTGVAALTAVSLTLGGFASAQAGPGSAAAEISGLQRTLAAGPGYLQLSYDQGTLQAVLTGSGDAASPTFRTSALKGEHDAGFRTVHTYTSLSEVVSYYWNALTRLGFEGTAESVAGATAIYTFEKDELQVRVVFSQEADNITVKLSWLQPQVG